MRARRTLTAVLLWLPLLAACSRAPQAPDRQASADRARFEQGVLVFCGQAFRLGDGERWPGDAQVSPIFSIGQTTLTLEAAGANAALHTDLGRALPRTPGAAPLSGQVAIVLNCDAPANRALADPAREQWDARIPHPDLDLLQLRGGSRAGPTGQQVYVPLRTPWRMPDGAPYVLTCFADAQDRPVRCGARFKRARVSVSYTYPAASNLGRWKDIDLLVRDILDIKE
ncbi:hypothetical protein ACLB90_15840 [Stenotrophomonas sp. LGBM10]|uniref:hypothetical protein n=1 Tax=Stenotrophomonas sp. LGBM10 TaxID=3390038 RepID=UPI00398A96D0